MFVSPILMTNLITNPEKCDFSCFELIQLGGSAVFDDLMDNLKVSYLTYLVLITFGYLISYFKIKFWKFIT